MSDNKSTKSAAPMADDSKQPVFDCLEGIQKKLLARGYKYHDVEPEDWPNCDSLMCLDEVALLLCPLPQKPSDEYIKQLAIQAGRFSGLILVGTLPINDKYVSRIFSKVKGRYAYIDVNKKQFRKRTFPSLLNPIPWALGKNSLAAFINGELSKKDQLQDCPQAMRDHLASHEEVEQFMQDMTKAVGVKSPIVTKVMIGIFVGLFVAMVVKLFFALSPHRVVTNFLPEYLLDWGAIKGSAVAGGQYWRIITSGFLHANLMHLVFNAMGCWFFGAEVERYQGRARLVGCFVFAVITGNLAGLLVHPDSTGVGASGGLFGLIGMMAAMTIRYYRQFPPAVRQSLKSWILTILLYNVFFIFMPNVDVAAHVGGFLGGLIMGLIVARPPLSKGLPSLFTIIMATIVLIATANLGVRIVKELKQYYNQPVRQQLSPDNISRYMQEHNGQLPPGVKVKRVILVPKKRNP